MSAGLSLDVIVDNHNYARYVGRAIESALNQTHGRVRVIVVDDGSTDDSRRVIESYGGEILAVFKERGGQASAFNAGFARSSADVVVFLDSDDELAPWVGERITAAFEEDASLARIQYRMEVIDEDGRRTGSIKPAAHLPMSAGDLRRQELAFPFDLTWMATSGNAFAASALRRIFPMPEEDFPILADLYLVHLSSLLGKVASLDDAGGFYRVHGANRFEPSNHSLDLERVRQMVTYAARARRHLERLAGELDLPDRSPSLSVSDLANRLVSLKLDAARHPLAEDTLPGVLTAGLRASARRFDVRWPMKALFALWFSAVALSPKALTPRLAEAFMFPERRPRINRVLGALHVRD